MGAPTTQLVSTATPVSRSPIHLAISAGLVSASHTADGGASMTTQCRVMAQWCQIRGARDTIVALDPRERGWGGPYNQRSLHAHSRSALVGSMA
jgi:hypothetical protein